MRRVIQRTITTTKIISLTITHSEEEVEYTLTTGADQSTMPELPLPDESDTAITIESESVQPDVEVPDATADTPDAHAE